jgi:hypothetical protein
MTDQCPRAFDETLISGHLDGELTQAAQQKVRLHLQDCGHCRALLGELQAMRETTISTVFSTPDDDQWDERPRGTTSLLTRSTGWIVAIMWAVSFAAYAMWQFWQSSANIWERLFVFGGLTAIALLFISVLIDRFTVARSDPYTEVEK